MFNEKEAKHLDETNTRMYGNIDDTDTGGYFVKSPWLQDGVSINRFDQTEKSVDRYLQAVLDKY